MKLLHLIESLIIENYQLEKLKEKYVGEGKKLSEEDFKQIMDVSLNKFNFVSWLTIKVANDIIKMEDVYKFKNYFSTFEKNKSEYKHKDINQYKTHEDVEYFRLKSIEIDEKNIKRTGGSDLENKDNYVSSGEMKKLESVGIKYLGMSEGFQVFEVPGTLKGNESAYKVYKSVLGRCQGRSEGEGIQICTIANFDYFNQYFKDYPDSSYFVLFNMGDPLSPYQIHFESSQFKDKNDTEYGI